MKQLVQLLLSSFLAFNAQSQKTHPSLSKFKEGKTYALCTTVTLDLLQSGRPFFNSFYDFYIKKIYKFYNL